MSPVSEDVSEDDSGNLRVDVVHATPALQKTVSLRVARGTTVRDAAMASNLDRYFQGLDLARVALGIWGRAVADQVPVKNGDRVELYRPLPMDPRELRREWAKQSS